MKARFFKLFRNVLVLSTGRGNDRSGWMNNLHHKLSYRLHKALPFLGITGIQRVGVPGMPGRFMYVRAEDGGVAHQLIMYREYEPFESKLVREHLKPGMTVYNIGANLGYYSLLASECIGAGGKVFAFEPESRNLELLRKTIVENGCYNVEICSMAVSQETGAAMLSISEANSGDHRLTAIANREQVKVEVTSIDTFIAQGHAPPDTIIMDVQGSELDVLRGAESLLQSNTPLILFTEFWPGGLNERHPNGARAVLDILERAGFQFHQIDERKKRLIPITGGELIRKFHGDMEVNLLCTR
ncbi:MAG TPA: FkbM family methyltransferase [Candidatus Kapabacteria bacterium]|nr:FkbM family methyltransferase [Candidatus Kapabacteria bacterium]